jgi:bifunctional UDP-N-acetylglucosamine pyrophosphorylase/glucosamine-1-phosphate N-acetyltransferase
MKAVILAAGLGKRLNLNAPKCLAKVGNKTLIEHNIEKLRKAGIEKIGVVVGHKKEMVKKILGSSVSYYEQEKQLGTAHALFCAKDFIEEKYFLAMYGDIFFTDDLSNFLRLKPAIAAFWVEDTSRYGKLWVKGGELVKIKEKLQEVTPGLINAGIYIFPQEIFEMIKKTQLSPRGEYEITDTIQMMIEEGFRFKVCRLRGYWHDIAYLDDLKAANKFFESQIRL